MESKRGKSKKMGGFNFSTESKILRWLVRGDTIYDIDLPEKSYYKAMSGCAVRGYINTASKILEDKVNKENVKLVISEF